MGFFDKKKNKKDETINLYYAKGLITAGLISIGADSDVTEIELDMINSILVKKMVPPSEVTRILKDITPKLRDPVEKKMLLTQVTSFITINEKQEILKYCCQLAASDKKISENEIKIIKWIAKTWGIPERSATFIISNEIK